MVLGKNSNHAVLLASGGLDSTVTAASARQAGYELLWLTVDYGQRHAIEIERARQVAVAMHAVKHTVVAVDLRRLGGSALTNDLPVPKDRPSEERTRGIPITYVPGRNLVFLALAAAHAEAEGASVIYFGANVVDYSGYPDCRPEFIAAFQQLASLATKRGVEGGKLVIDAPLVTLSKAGIIRVGRDLGVDYSLTVSCYQADQEGRACGRCDSCRLRREGFAGAGVPDPTRYR